MKPPIQLILAIIICISALALNILASSYINLPELGITGKVQGQVGITVYAVCGDSYCTGNAEDQTNCCTDCGCPAGQTCTGNVCASGAAAALPSYVPSAGGGGAAAAAPKAAFSVSTDSMQIILTPGQTTEKTFKLKNEGKIPLDATIEIEGLEDNIDLSASEVYLAKTGQEIKVVIFAYEDQAPGIYVGSIVIRTKDIVKKITVVLEVQSKEAAFDLEIYLPERFRKIYAGQTIEPQITIFDMAKIGKADVHAYYEIKDSAGNTISSEDEIITVTNQETFTKTFLLSESLAAGDYVLAFKVVKGGAVGTASKTFSIIEERKAEFTPGLLTYAGITLAFISIILYAVYTKAKLGKLKKKR